MHVALHGRHDDPALGLRTLFLRCLDVRNEVCDSLLHDARIITAAAVLLAVVFAAFVTSGVTSIKMMGFGVAFAVVLDATLIRALLVPALMRLLGERNWWAPKAMQRFTLKH